jgi:hypothetical protein
MNLSQFQEAPDTLEGILGKPLHQLPTPSPGRVLVWGGVAVALLLLWEQVKFAWWRRGKGAALPGAPASWRAASARAGRLPPRANLPERRRRPCRQAPPTPCPSSGPLWRW